MTHACEITCVPETHAVLARCSGEIDLSVVPDMRALLDARLDAEHANVVMDLSGVTYADSSALGLLVWLDRRVRPFDGRVVLTGANKDISRILELSGLVGLAESISMSANADAALEGFALPADPGSEQSCERIEVRVDPEGLVEARHQTIDSLRGLDFSESVLFDLSVAVGEALSNVFRHGRPVSGRAQACVSVSVFSDRAVIDVDDNGPGLSGRSSLDRDHYAPGGRGIMLMHRLVDRVEIGSSDSGGMRVRLVKHRRGVN